MATEEAVELARKLTKLPVNPLVDQSRLQSVYEGLRELAAQTGDAVLILSGMDPDAVCAVRILMDLMVSDNVRFQVRPVRGYDEFSDIAIKLRSGFCGVVLLNCGANENVRLLLGLDSLRGNFLTLVVDSHRPLYHGNLKPRSGQYSGVDGGVRLFFADCDVSLEGGLDAVPSEGDSSDFMDEEEEEDLEEEEEEGEKDDDGELAMEWDPEEVGGLQRLKEQILDVSRRRDKAIANLKQVGEEEEEEEEEVLSGEEAENMLSGEEAEDMLSGDEAEDEGEEEEDVLRAGSKRERGKRLESRGRKRRRRLEEKVGGLSERLERLQKRYDALAQKSREEFEGERREKFRRRRWKKYHAHDEFHAGPAALALYRLAKAEGKERNDALWLAIVGTSDHHLREHYGDMDYDVLYSELLSEVQVMNPDAAWIGSGAELTASGVTERDRGVMAADIRPAGPYGHIRPIRDLRALMHRHWTLWESLFYSPYVAPRLGCWVSEIGEERLSELLLESGIALADARQRWNHCPHSMRLRTVTTLPERASEQGLQRLSVSSFLRQQGFDEPTSAADVAQSIAALLEAGGRGISGVDLKPSEENTLGRGNNSSSSSTTTTTKKYSDENDDDNFLGRDPTTSSSTTTTKKSNLTTPNSSKTPAGSSPGLLDLGRSTAMEGFYLAMDALGPTPEGQAMLRRGMALCRDLHRQIARLCPLALRRLIPIGAVGRGPPRFRMARFDDLAETDRRLFTHPMALHRLGVSVTSAAVAADVQRNFERESNGKVPKPIDTSPILLLAFDNKTEAYTVVAVPVTLHPAESTKADFAHEIEEAAIRAAEEGGHPDGVAIDGFSGLSLVISSRLVDDFIRNLAAVFVERIVSLQQPKKQLQEEEEEEEEDLEELDHQDQEQLRNVTDTLDAHIGNLQDALDDESEEEEEEEDEDEDDFEGQHHKDDDDDEDEDPSSEQDDEDPQDLEETTIAPED